jgi:hypothetical protein
MRPVTFPTDRSLHTFLTYLSPKFYINFYYNLENQLCIKYIPIKFKKV